MSSGSYENALQKAGAEVVAFDSFGDYQGSWWAYVKYKGKEGWVHGSYGSCSGCDAFQAEIGYLSHWVNEDKDYHDYYDDEFPHAGCDKCTEAAEKIAAFGRSYLDDIVSQDEALKIASENLDWDMDAQEVVDFIKKEGKPQ